MAFIDAGSSLYSAQDLMRKILVRRPEACVVVTSSEPSVDMAVEFIKDGAWDFLIRPVEPEKLALVLDQTIGGSDKAAAPIDEDEEDGPAIITNDPAFKKLLSIAEQAAGAAAAVLIQGESGTGKEMLARFIHMKSPRRDKPFVAINCAALPEALLESELFGHEKGAFTGAISRRLGKFELASGGSILLDEITEMQLHLQAKLLRVLQEQVLDRVGGQAPVNVDVRIIATTNRPVATYIEEGNFREDLYYRLNVIPLYIPPLRDRRGDIPPLIGHFIKKHNKKNNKSISKISDEVYEVLLRLPWKGNVRELENAVERAVVLAPGDELRVEHLLLDQITQDSVAPASSQKENGLETMVGMTVQEMERQLIISTLGKVSENRTKAAEMLGISIRTLRNKLKEYQSQSSSS
ncbi:MAG: sigma-54 dependent transcriptional regulator [Nitrospinota bacterium]